MEVECRPTPSVVRNPGDGQQREEDNEGAAAGGGAGSRDNLVHIELTPYEAGKAGFTGNRPALKGKTF